jgi:hypothetical protein
MFEDKGLASAKVYKASSALGLQHPSALGLATFLPAANSGLLPRLKNIKVKSCLIYPV